MQCISLFFCVVSGLRNITAYGYGCDHLVMHDLVLDDKGVRVPSFLLGEGHKKRTKSIYNFYEREAEK